MKENSKLNEILIDKIRLDILVKFIWKSKKKFILPMFLTAVLSSAIMLCIPRYYNVKVMLAPEYSNGSSGSLGGFSGIASMIGVNLGNLSSSDAIIPVFYPDVISSKDFLVPLMEVKVTTIDSAFSGRYVDYLTKYQESPFWNVWIETAKSWIKEPEVLNETKGYTPNPYRLTKLEDKIVKGINSSISCNVDKKTDIITLTVTAQDPLVATLLADTIQQRLQNFITEYRTRKSRNEVEYYTQLYGEAREDYLRAQEEYAEFADSHYDLVLNEYKIIEEKLENDMQMAYSVYNSVSQQKVLAEAKLRERTPAFTTLQSASVPVKHSGPKRMITVGALTLLSFVVTAVVLLAKARKGDDEYDEIPMNDEMNKSVTDEAEYVENEPAAEND